MSKAHYDALKSLLPAGLNVYRGSAPIKPVSSDYPYVVIGGNNGDEDSETACGEFDSLDIRFKFTYAGLTVDSLFFIMEKVRDAVRGERLPLSGWSSNKIRPRALLDITTDHDVTLPDSSLTPVFSVDEIHVRCSR